MDKEPTATPPNDKPIETPAVAEPSPPMQETPTTAAATDGSEANEPIINQQSQLAPNTKRKTSRLLLLVLLLVVAAGSAAAYMLTRDKAKLLPDNSSPIGVTERKIEKGPFALNYAAQQGQKVLLNQVELSNGTANNIETIEDMYFSGGDTIDDKVVMVLTGGFETSTKAIAIYYSDDAGKSFQNVYEAPLAKDDSTLDDQVTSVKLSQDGKKIVLGYLTTKKQGEIYVGINTIKEIDVATKKITDLFALEDGGVFIFGYDGKTLIYSTGCFNCDGNRRNKIISRDIAEKKDTTVFEDSKAIGMEIRTNKAMTKLALIMGVQGEFLGGGPPYSVLELDLATKQTKKVGEIKETTNVYAGYDSSDALFYSADKTLYRANENEQYIATYEAAKTIWNVLYLDNDRVILSLGDANSGNREIVDAYIGQKSSKELIRLTEVDQLIGITVIK